MRNSIPLGILLLTGSALATPLGRYTGNTGPLGRPCTVSFETATDGVAVHVEVPRQDVLHQLWLSDHFTLASFEAPAGEDSRMALRSMPAEASGDQHEVILRFENGEPVSLISTEFFDIGLGETRGQRLRCSSLRPAR